MSPSDAAVAAPLTKKARQQLLLDILKKGGAQSQFSIQREFQRRGVEVSQVTVSRDLRELGVAKLPGEKGRAYALKESASPKANESRLRRALKEYGLSMEAAGQFVVIKTPPSGAPPVGLAIDQAGLPEVAGTIAGDDTVFVLLRDAREAVRLLKKLQDWAAGPVE